MEPDSDYPSYRFHLWNMLRDGGYDVDFVGSTTEPNFQKFVFDQDHDGYSGYTTESLADDMERILVSNTPDIVLLYIGTNDVMRQVPMKDRIRNMGRIVASLRAKNPNVRILIAQISPTSDLFRNDYAELETFNEELITLAQDRSTSSSPIVLVDMHTAWSPALFDQEDGLHPNNEGEVQIAERWANALISTGMIALSQATPQPTVLPTTAPPSPTMTSNAGTSYLQARGYYDDGARAWSRAWGASEIGQIRQYLTEARTAYANCLATANTVNDPSNAANLALVRSISTAYIDLADAALSMYSGADTNDMGRAQMTVGSHAEAASSFQEAGRLFSESNSRFTRATTTLQSVSYAGTEYGDGTAYTAAIVPILNNKAAYMGEFSTYAQGWQHTALAYRANARGDQAAFSQEREQAMGLFRELRTSSAFGDDARANYDILARLVP